MVLNQGPSEDDVFHDGPMKIMSLVVTNHWSSTLVVQGISKRSSLVLPCQWSSTMAQSLDRCWQGHRGR